MTTVSNNSDAATLDVVKDLIETHPNLAPQIEAMAAKKRGRSPIDIDFLFAMNNDLLSKSKAQLRQDLFVLHELNFKRGGFFVEFGATNGIDLSNSFLLEKWFGWTGVLAEPAACWHDSLERNRAAHIEKRCVWSTSGCTFSFNEVGVAELSTLQIFNSVDGHAETRKSGKTYDVETISLNDLLDKYDAPLNIDYLSIDTEGSEYDILNNFDFQKRTIKIITVEHNHTQARSKLFDLLTANGYVRKHENISRFDDWYVKI